MQHNGQLVPTTTACTDSSSLILRAAQRIRDVSNMQYKTCLHTCSSHARATQNAGARVTRAIPPAALCAAGHAGFNSVLLPSRQRQWQPPAASFCGQYVLRLNGERLGSCDSGVRIHSNGRRRNSRRSHRRAVIPVSASAAPSASVHNRNGSSSSSSSSSSSNFSRHTFKSEQRLPPNVPSHSGMPSSADTAINSYTGEGQAPSIMPAPHFPTPGAPGGHPVQHMPIVTNSIPRRTQGNVHVPPGPEPAEPALQNVPNLCVGPAELADILGVPVRSARALLSQQGGPLRQLTVGVLTHRCTLLSAALGLSMEQVLTLASRQPEVLRTDATPAAVAAQVRQMAAALGLHPTLFAGLVARQPEFLEVAPPERLAARAEALARVLGLTQHAYQVKSFSKPKPTPGHTPWSPPQLFADSQSSLPPRSSPSAPHTPIRPDFDQRQREDSPMHPSPPSLPLSPFPLLSPSPSAAGPSNQPHSSSAPLPAPPPAQNSSSAKPFSSPSPAPAAVPSSSVPQPVPFSPTFTSSPSEGTLLDPLLGRARSGAEQQYEIGSSSSSRSSSNGSGTILIRPSPPHTDHEHALHRDHPPAPTAPYPSAQTHMRTLHYPDVSLSHYNSGATVPGREVVERSRVTAQETEAEQMSRQAATAMRRVARRAAQAEAKARTRVAALSVMARLPATEFFMLIALPPAALQRRLLQLEGILLNQGMPDTAATLDTTYNSTSASSLSRPDTGGGPWGLSGGLHKQSSPVRSQAGGGGRRGHGFEQFFGLQRKTSPKQSFGKEDVWGEYVRGLCAHSSSSSGNGGGGGSEMGALSGNHASNILISFGSSSSGPGLQQQHQCLHPFRSFPPSVFYAPGLHWIVEPASPSAAAGAVSPAQSSAALSGPLPNSQGPRRSSSSTMGTDSQNGVDGSSTIMARQIGAGRHVHSSDTSSSSSSSSNSNNSSKGTKASRSQALHLNLKEGADMDDDCASVTGSQGRHVFGAGNNGSISLRGSNAVLDRRSALGVGSSRSVGGSSSSSGRSIGSSSSSGRSIGGGGEVGEGYGVIDVRGIVAACPMLLVAPLREVSSSWRALCVLLGPHSKTAQRCALVARDPALLLAPPRSLKATMDWVCSELGMSASQAATCVLQQPKLLKREPDALQAQMQELAAIWGVPLPRVRGCLRKCPSLLAHEPRSLGAKVQAFQRLLCISSSQVLDLVLQVPVLLTHSPHTLAQKLDNMAVLFSPPSLHQQPEPPGSPQAAGSKRKSSVKVLQHASGPVSQQTREQQGDAPKRQAQQSVMVQQLLVTQPGQQIMAQQEKAQQSVALSLALAEPHLLTQAPGSLRAKLVAIAEHLDIPLQHAKQLVLRCPALLALSTQQLMQRVQQLAWTIEGDLELELARRQRTQQSAHQLAWTTESDPELELDHRRTTTSAVSPTTPHMHTPTRAAADGHSMGQASHAGDHGHAHVQEEDLGQWQAPTWNAGRAAEVKEGRKRARAQQRQGRAQTKAVREAVCSLVCHWPQVLVDAEGVPPSLRQQTVWSLADVGAKKRRQIQKGN